MGAPYIVWSPEGEAPAKVSHPTHKAALSSAYHLAKLHPGRTFFVMARAGRPALVAAETADQNATEAAVQ